MTDQQFSQHLGFHDEWKELMVKLSILKKGLVDERAESAKLREQVALKHTRIKRVQQQIDKKQEANLCLEQQISRLKKQILNARSIKKDLFEQHMLLESDNEGSLEAAKSTETTEN